MVFEYIERSFPVEVQNEFRPCAEHCARSGVTQIGPCVPRGLLTNETIDMPEPTREHLGKPPGWIFAIRRRESELSDRGKPFCGGGQCCKRRDSHHPGDPGCFGKGCDGYHCCWDATTDKEANRHTLAVARGVKQPAFVPFTQQGSGGVCDVSGASFGDGDEVPPAASCGLKKVAVRRWWNKCGLHIPYQTPPGMKDPNLNMSTGWDDTTHSFRWGPPTMHRTHDGGALEPPFGSGTFCVYSPAGARTPFGGRLPSAASPEDGIGGKWHTRREMTLARRTGEFGAGGSHATSHARRRLRHPGRTVGLHRTYVKYEVYKDQRLGYWKVTPGEEPLIQWRVRSEFRSEAYKLALVWTDNAMLSRKLGFMQTLVPPQPHDGTVVNGLLYNIDPSALDSRHARSAEFRRERRAINGTNSWGMRAFVGPCAYPLGFPTFGKATKYKVQLIVYRHREAHFFRHPVTLDSFLRTVEHDVVGDCVFEPRSAVFIKETSDFYRAQDEGFTLTRSGEPIPRCDGLYGSDDFGRHGHNETEPCGAFGCNCRYSPGNCGDVRYMYQAWDEIEASSFKKARGEAEEGAGLDASAFGVNEPPAGAQQAGDDGQQAGNDRDGQQQRPNGRQSGPPDGDSNGNGPDFAAGDGADAGQAGSNGELSRAREEADRLRREAEEAEDRLNGLPDDATPEEVADARRERDLADARADVAESALDVRGGGVGPDLAPASNGGGPQQQGRPPGSGGPGQRRWVRKGKAATRVKRLK